MNPIYTKILRISGFIILGLLILIFLGFLGGMLYLKSESGQKWLTQTTNKFLQNQLQTELKIDSVTVSFPRELNLYKTVVYDHKNDTLLAAPEIGIKFNLYSFNLQSLIFGNLYLKEPRFYGKKYPGDTTFNYNMIINNLQSDEPKKKNEGIYRVLFNGIQIENGIFVHRNLHEKRIEDDRIDFNYLNVRKINLEADYLQFIEGDLTSEINHLSLKEESGFKINELRANLIFDNSTFSFQDLYLKTPYSKIQEQVTMEYDDKSELNNFIEEVKLITRFKDAHLSFYDLSYFAPGIQRVDRQVNFSGEIIGTIAGFKSKNFKLAFGEKTFFRGSISFDGLPQIGETFININCKESQFITSDFKQLFPDISMPLNLRQLGIVSFKGNFTGFISDFVAYGNFNTALGSFKTDINLKNPGDNKNARYSGKLTLNNFDVGKLIGEELLGRASLNGRINGQGLTLKHLRANLKADVSKVYFKDYKYQNITVSGDLAKELFTGNFNMNDPNVNLDFQGTINLAKEKPEFDFIADIKKANFYALNFVKDTLILDSRINLNFAANNLDNIEGNAYLKNTKIRLSDRELIFDSLALSSVIEGDKNQYKKLNLRSDIADVSLEGNYNITSLDNIGKMTMSRLVNKKLIPGDTFATVQENINYNVHIKNAAFLMELLKTNLILEDNTKLAGSINTKTGDFTLDGKIPGLYYKDWYANNIKITGSGSKNSLFLKSSLDQLTMADTQILKNSSVNLFRNEGDSLQFNFTLNHKKQRATILGKLMAGKNNVTGRIYDSRIHLMDTTWKLSSRNITYFYDSSILVPLMEFTNKSQRIAITGEVSHNPKTPLRILFNEVDLSTFTSGIFPKYNAYTGVLNGQALLYNLFDKPYFNSGLMITPIMVNKDTMGNLSLNSNYNPETRNVNIEASLTSPEQETLMETIGYINFHGEDNLNLVADFNETKLALIDGLVNDYISNLKGTFQSLLTIEGSFENPVIRGKINFNNAALTLNYLQTRYHFDHEISFNENEIPINDLVLKDVNGNKAIANGKIQHNYFNDFRLDVKMNVNNFQALNTKKKDNDIYYGEAYASGFIEFTGSLSNININMQVRSEKNTVINLPVYGDSEYSGYEFINFIDKRKYFQTEHSVDFGGINLNMELEVTPDALVRIIFDPKTGDILKGRGQGNLQLEITSAGEFNMYGSYTINEGDYLFTAFDVIKKRFQLKEGGTIKWNGNPYEAQMDIQAAYQVQASLAPLLENSVEDKQSYNQKVPVEAQLFLTGSLFSPTIDLNFEILDLESSRSANISALNSQIRKIKNDEQALNQQVVSLLIMNRFVESSGLGASKAFTASSNSLVGDLISNQLTYWVSKFSDEIKYLENVQLGINYQGSNEMENGEISQKELEVALSTTLFNDRVAISGSMDMQSSAGNVEVSYRITPEGKVRIKFFSRNNNNPILNENIQTHGVGILWRKEFNSWAEFFGTKDKPEKKEEDKKEKKDDQEKEKSEKQPKDKGTLNREKELEE